MPPHATRTQLTRILSPATPQIRLANTPRLTKIQHSRQIPAGFLTACVLIALIETVIANHWLPLSDPVGLSWRFSKIAASSVRPDTDLLCLGDSLVKHGVVPHVIKSRSGLTSINLSAARSPTLMSYYLFQQALEAGARPRAILFNAKPAVLLGDPDYNAQYWPYALSLPNLVDFAARTHKPKLIATAALAQLFPSIRSRLQLRSSTLAALNGTTDKLQDVNPVLWRNWTVNQGANVASSNAAFSGTLPSDVIEKLHPDRFYAHPSNRAAITDILQLAASRGIHVYWLLPPISPPLQSLREASGAEVAYEKFIRAYLEQFPGKLTVLDARRSGFSNQHFIDPTHLNGHGAIALSSSIATALDDGPQPRQTAQDAQWITLPPPPKNLLADPGLENLEQSRIELNKTSKHLQTATDRTR